MTYRYRNAITGRYTTKAWAQKHPRISVREKVKPCKAKRA